MKDEDWFDKGLGMLKEDISKDTGIDLEDVETIYAELVNRGYIDYDTEKEIIWDEYFSNDDLQDDG